MNNTSDKTIQRQSPTTLFKKIPVIYSDLLTQLKERSDVMLIEVLIQINSGKLVARNYESFTAAIHEILEWVAELALRAHDIVILDSIKRK